MPADPTASDEFRRRGIVLAGRVGAEAVASAARDAHRLLPAEREALHYSTASDDHEYRAEVSAALGLSLVPHVEPLLGDGLDYLFGVFVAQRPGPGTGMGFHHDLSFVDEQRHRAVAAWVPLIDVDTNSGTLSVLPGSHLDVASPRGTPTFPSPLRDVPQSTLAEAMETVSAPAGTVVLTDPRLAHASTDNRGTVERVTAILVFVERGAPLLHHYQWPDGRIERFRVAPGFYTRFHLTNPLAEGTSLGIVAADFEPLSVDEFERRHPRPRAQAAPTPQPAA